MSRCCLTVLLIALFAVPVPAKPFYKSKRFWIGEIAMGTAYALDAHSTAVTQRRCPTCVEQHRIGGGVWLGFGLETWYAIAAHSLLRNDPNRVWRFAGDVAVPAATVVIESHAIIHNYHLCDHTTLRCTP